MFTQVAVYQVRQEGSTEVSTFKTSPKGKINIEMAQGNKNIEMRVKYHGFEGWSQWQWVASDALVMSSGKLGQTVTSLLNKRLISYMLMFRGLSRRLTPSCTPPSSYSSAASCCSSSGSS